jgi:hypothetical protein
MSFRHDGEQSRRWHQWLAAHRDELIRCGVPDTALVDELCWLRFMEEDGCDYITGWTPRLLSPEQAQALKAFILREYPEQASSYRSFLHLLDKISKRGEAGN